MTYFKRTKQEIINDTNNCSAINLATNNDHTFIGAGTSTLGMSLIRVSLRTDKDAIVQIQQSSDNINWDIIDSFNFYASANDMSWSVGVKGSYMRTVVTTASLVTTYFRLQTILGTSRIFVLPYPPNDMQIGDIWIDSSV